MLNKHEFDRTCQILGLDDYEIDLATLVWEKCERVMQGNTAQQAVLLGAKQLPKRPEQLSQSELQMLYDRLRHKLSQGFEELESRKSNVAYLWDKCDKSDPTTLYVFKMLNQQKNSIQMLKNEIAKESELIRKIKKLLRTKQKGKV